MKGQNSKLPTLGIKLLKWFCPDELLEGVLHDYEEQYDESEKSRGRVKASFRFYWNVIRLLHPSILFRNKMSNRWFNSSLLKNHLVVSTRSMMKYKFYSAINLIGLSLAITFSLFVFLFIDKETNYDKFHQNGDNIYRVAIELKKGEEVMGRSAVTAIPLGLKLKDEVASVQAATRFASNSATIIIDNQPYQETAHFVDSSFFEIFSFPLIEGNAEALNLKNHIAISSDKAAQYFGDESPIGRSLEFEISGSAATFVIQAVIDNRAVESSLALDFILPIGQYALVVSEQVMASLDYAVLENYVVVQKGSSIDNVIAAANTTLNPDPTDDHFTGVILQPLKSIHLEADITGNSFYTDPVKFLIMGGLALLVLSVSIINFITLSSSHSLIRMKEIGLRSAMGANKVSIRLNLMLENFVTALMANLIALGLTLLLLPFFNQLLGLEVLFTPNSNLVLLMLSLSALIALINGGVQSLTLLKIKPLNSLRGVIPLIGRPGFVNQSLIVLQFTISIVLIIGTIIIHSQMTFIQKKDLGFNQNNLIQVPLDGNTDFVATSSFVDRVTTELLNNNRIIAVSPSMNNLSEPWTLLEFAQEDETREQLTYNLVGAEFMQTMNLELILGDFFDPDRHNPSTDIVVNEALVRHFGWQNALEEQIPGKYLAKPHRIIGVVKDFHFSSLKNKVDPLILAANNETLMDGVGGLSTYVWPPNYYQMYIRFSQGEITSVLDYLSETWDEINPNTPFNYDFVDSLVERQYLEEKRSRDIVNVSSAFSIFIAWLGLIGLTRLTMQRRKKEVGIRKVLGSSVMNITSLLSKRFLILVLVANMIAWPFSYWLANNWLASFPYRIEISLFTFLIGGLSVFFLVLISVGLQSISSARTNPVESLRYE
ncbi:MAG: ABC transporter permease [Cyclobacteriaceae bacterium]